MIKLFFGLGLIGNMCNVTGKRNRLDAISIGGKVVFLNVAFALQLFTIVIQWYSPQRHDDYQFIGINNSAIDNILLVIE